MTRPTIQERLDRLSVDSANGCREWIGSKGFRGYGRISIKHRAYQAHRIAYELVRGPIPDGLVIDHLCRNAACINPAHMEPVTSRENILRGTGRAAINARKTHCIRGHEFTAENTGRTTRGRFCQECKRSYYQRVTKPRRRSLRRSL